MRSFKAVFMQQLPRFIKTAGALLPPEQKKAALQLISDSSDAAWASRAAPPFADTDVCNEFRDPPAPSDGPPKFTWDWRSMPIDELTCMDSRTQGQAFSLFVADLVMALQE